MSMDNDEEGGTINIVTAAAAAVTPVTVPIVFRPFGMSLSSLAIASSQGNKDNDYIGISM